MSQRYGSNVGSARRRARPSNPPITDESDDRVLVDLVIQDSGVRVSGRQPASPFLLLESKFAPPLLPSRTVPRKALLAALREAKTVPVVTVVAPSGYGKTTMGSQWARRDRRPFAWLSVDDGDNDPGQLLRDLGMALAPSCPIDPELFGTAGRLAGPALERWTASVAEAVGAAPTPMVLIVDDAQRLRSKAATGVLNQLIENVGHGSQIGLLSRAELQLPAASLRAEGRILEVGTRDLTMTVEEAGTLLQHMHLQLDRHEVEDLADVTEGWPAALYLMGLSLGDTRFGRTATLSHLRQTQSVVDYVRSEFLDGLDPDRAAFLTRTSVLSRLSGAMCDAVLGQTGSGRVLAGIARRNMLLIPLDQHGERFRYHHLLRQVLRTDLEESEPDGGRDLLRRAALWCEDRGLISESLEYAMELGDPELLGRLLEANAMTLHRHGRDASLLPWFAWFEDNDLLLRYPRLAILGAWLHAFQGRGPAARRWAEAAEQGAEDLPKDEREWVEGMRVLLRSAQSRSGPEQMERDAERGSALLWDDPAWRSVGLLLQAVARRMMGVTEGLDPLLITTVEEAIDVDDYPTASLGLTERAILAVEQEEWTAAKQLVDQALAIVRRGALQEYVTSVPLYAVAARVAIHEGDTGAAKDLLIHAQRLRNDVSHVMPALAVQTRLQLARAYLGLTDAAGARTMLREIESILALRPDLGVFRAESAEIYERLSTVTAVFLGGSSLTAAELRLLPLLATQYSFPEIAKRLYVSRHTVKTQAISIYRKLHVTSRTAAIETAREAGLLAT
jgi:LuxR family maltose regulon positive regulatory protein